MNELFEDLGYPLAQLTRIAQRHGEKAVWLQDVFRRDLDRFALPALEVAIETGDPIGRELARQVTARASTELARQLDLKLAESRYNESVPLWEVALSACERVLATGEDEELPDDVRARLLNNRAVRLDNLGRWEEALEASESAVRLLRGLAGVAPEVYLPALAMALDNLGTQLNTAGRSAEGLEALDRVHA